MVQNVSDKKYVSELSRSDAMALFAKGREVPEGGTALNQKTINRKVMIMIMAMRNQGAVITLKKGDWPNTTDKDIQRYEPEDVTAFFAACNAEERLVFKCSWRRVFGKEKSPASTGRISTGGTGSWAHMKRKVMDAERQLRR